MYSTVGDTTGEVLGWTKADKLSPDSMDRRECRHFYMCTVCK